MTRQVNRRPYDATKRQASSHETRNRILATARTAIIERGYRGATVAQIAAGAGVNVDTVYELVGRKPLILRELIERAISGADEVIAAKDRGYVKAIQAEPDPNMKLSIYAQALCSIQGRLAPLYLALRDASKTEPEAHEVWQEISDRRASNMRKLARDLSGTGRLREGVTISEAADILWATNSSELYVLFTVDRRWSARRYERWLADAWRRLLLRDM
ncbi:MAG TPA: TetR/AcrR family transcriptional regulator [Acidimicrobiales bacterium]|nr:TetR/AcrR family transcriptional regulator [Acidimicrobiales bacterium]